MGSNPIGDAILRLVEAFYFTKVKESTSLPSTAICFNWKRFPLISTSENELRSAMYFCVKPVIWRLREETRGWRFRPSKKWRSGTRLMRWT